MNRKAYIGVVIVAIAFLLSSSVAASLFWAGGAAIFFALLEPFVNILMAIKSVDRTDRKKS